MMCTMIRTALKRPVAGIVVVGLLLLVDALGEQAAPGVSTDTASLPLGELVRYDDPEFGFSMAIPDRWHIIVTENEEPVPDPWYQDPGYSIGFESPRSGPADQFSDYIMVEILPGAESGAFETDGSHTQWVHINGALASRDRLHLPDFRIRDRAFDLVVHQAVITELGYTIGFFAVGEPGASVQLEAAFEALIRTFQYQHIPFDII